MQEAVSLSDILRELKEIKHKIDHIEEIIEDLLDSTPTPEEAELLEEIKEKIKREDLSDFIPLEKLDDALRE